MIHQKYIFSREELEGLKIGDLSKLAFYYGIEVEKSSSKRNLIDAILEAQSKNGSECFDDSYMKMSVRIERISNQNRKEK